MAKKESKISEKVEKIKKAIAPENDVPAGLKVDVPQINVKQEGE